MFSEMNPSSQLHKCTTCLRFFDANGFLNHDCVKKALDEKFGIGNIASISRRDFFAAMAMHSLQIKGSIDMETRIKAAAEIADAMIKELDKKDV